MFYTTTQQPHLNLTLTDIVRYHLFPQSNSHNILSNSIFIPQVSSLQVINIPLLFTSLLPFREHVHYILSRFIPDLSSQVLSSIIDFCLTSTTQDYPRLPISIPDPKSTTNTSITPKHRIFDASHIFDERWFNKFVRMLIQTILNIFISYQLQHLSSQQQEQVFQIQLPSNFSAGLINELKPEKDDLITRPPPAYSQNASPFISSSSQSSQSFTTIKILFEVIGNVAIISWLYLEIIRSPTINPNYQQYVTLYARYKSISNNFLVTQTQSDNLILSTHHHRDVYTHLQETLDELTIKSTSLPHLQNLHNLTTQSLSSASPSQFGPSIHTLNSNNLQNINLDINKPNNQLSTDTNALHNLLDPPNSIFFLPQHVSSNQPLNQRQTHLIPLQHQIHPKFKNDIIASQVLPLVASMKPSTFSSTSTFPISSTPSISAPPKASPRLPHLHSSISHQLQILAQTFNYPPILFPCTSSTVHIAAYYTNILTFPIIPINHVFSQHLFDININDVTNELISLVNAPRHQPLPSTMAHTTSSNNFNTSSSSTQHKFGNLYPITDGPLSLGLLLRIWQRYLIKTTPRLIFPSLPIPIIISFLTAPIPQLDNIIDQYLQQYYSNCLRSITPNQFNENIDKDNFQKNHTPFNSTNSSESPSSARSKWLKTPRGTNQFTEKSPQTTSSSISSLHNSVTSTLPFRTPSFPSTYDLFGIQTLSPSPSSSSTGQQSLSTSQFPHLHPQQPQHHQQTQLHQHQRQIQTHQSISRSLNQISPQFPSQHQPLPLTPIVLEYLHLYQFLSFAFANLQLSSPIAALVSPLFPFKYAESFQNQISLNQFNSTNSNSQTKLPLSSDQSTLSDTAHEHAYTNLTNNAHDTTHNIPPSSNSQAVFQCFSKPIQQLILNVDDLRSFCPFCESDEDSSDDSEDEDSHNGNNHQFDRKIDNQQNSENGIQFSSMDIQRSINYDHQSLNGEEFPNIMHINNNNSNNSLNPHSDVYASTPNPPGQYQVQQSKSSSSLVPTQSMYDINTISSSSPPISAPALISASQKHQQNYQNSNNVNVNDIHASNLATVQKLIVPATVSFNYIITKQFIDFTPRFFSQLPPSSSLFPMTSSASRAMEPSIQPSFMVRIDHLLHLSQFPALPVYPSQLLNASNHSSNKRKKKYSAPVALKTSLSFNNFNVLAEHLVYQRLGDSLCFSPIPPLQLTPSPLLLALPSQSSQSSQPSQSPQPPQPSQPPQLPLSQTAPATPELLPQLSTLPQPQPSPHSVNQTSPKLHVTVTLLNTDDPYISALHVCFHQMIHQTLSCCSPITDQPIASKRLSKKSTSRNTQTALSNTKTYFSKTNKRNRPDVSHDTTSEQTLCYIPCVTVYQYQHGTSSFNIQYTILHILLTLSKTIFKDSIIFRELFNPFDIFKTTPAHAHVSVASDQPSTSNSFLNSTQPDHIHSPTLITPNLSFSFSLMQPPCSPSNHTTTSTMPSTSTQTSLQPPIKAPLPPTPLISLLTLHVYRYCTIMLQFMRFMSISYSHCDLHTRIWNQFLFRQTNQFPAPSLSNLEPLPSKSSTTVTKPLDTATTAFFTDSSIFSQHLTTSTPPAVKSKSQAKIPFSFPFSLSASPALLVIHIDQCSSNQYTLSGSPLSTSPSHLSNRDQSHSLLPRSANAKIATNLSQDPQISNTCSQDISNNTHQVPPQSTIASNNTKNNHIIINKAQCLLQNALFYTILYPQLGLPTSLSETQLTLQDFSSTPNSPPLTTTQHQANLPSIMTTFFTPHLSPYYQLILTKPTSSTTSLSFFSLLLTSTPIGLFKSQYPRKFGSLFFTTNQNKLKDLANVSKHMLLLHKMNNVDVSVNKKINTDGEQAIPDKD